MSGRHTDNLYDWLRRPESRALVPAGTGPTPSSRSSVRKRAGRKLSSHQDVPRSAAGPEGAARPLPDRDAVPAASLRRDLVRDDVVLSAHTWVVKVGTSVLTGDNGTLDPARIGHLAEQISAVRDRGCKVALVSSGAVGAGMGQLGWRRRPDNLRQLQAAAAVGQAYLIRAYDEGFRRHRRHAAQLLLTHEDFDSRPQHLNMRNTLHACSVDAVPVIQQNDTISVDEIKFGDNDRSDVVANLLEARCCHPWAWSTDSTARTRPRRRRRSHPDGPADRRRCHGSGRCRPAARWGPAACRASWRRPGW